MSHFKQQYKNPRLGFGDTDHSRVVRTKKQGESRKENRTRAFNQNRELQDVSDVSTIQRHDDLSKITGERMKKLIRWREERKRKQQLENAKKKPVFKVGIVHHSLYSPVSKGTSDKVTTDVAKPSKQLKHVNNVPKRITRATEKRLLAKVAFTNNQIVGNPKNPTLKGSTKKVKPVGTKKPMINAIAQKSFAPSDHRFRPPSGLLNMPLFGHVVVEETPSEKGDFFIQEKLKENKTLDMNDQKNMLSQAIHTFDPIITSTARSKSSIISRLSSKRKSSPKLNRSVRDSDNTVSELNQIRNVISSLDKQTTKNSLSEEFFTEETSSSSSVDTRTPLQKTPPSTSTGKENGNEDLIVFSPYLTISRGKSKARKEQQLRLGIGRRSSGNIPTKDTVMQNLNISIEDEERTAQYFKFLLNKETDRLKELCTKWVDIQQQEDAIPEDAMYEINQAVGQTNLLISKKFERFRGLVLDCESGKGEMLVTCRDLQGFWDMTYMEIKDCDSRFEKLEQRRNRDWQEEQFTAVKFIAKKRVPTKKQIVPSKPSSLRSLILKARKNKMADTSDEKSSLNLNKRCVTPPLSDRKSVAFKENNDARSSAKKTIDRKSTPARRNSAGANLALKVQHSDTTKGMKSPFAIMKISRMCKTPEVQADDTISYVNSDQTPGKSILKKSEKPIDKEIRVKSAHKVNFDDRVALNEVPIDEETQIKLNLTAALDKINEFDLTDLAPGECIDTKKKLIYETEDSDSSMDSDNLENVDMHLQLKAQQSKPNKSVQEVFHSSNTNPLNDITFTISSQESANSNIKVKSSSKSLRNLARHKSTINDDKLEVPFINFLPATSLHTNIKTSEITLTAENMEQEEEFKIRTLRNRVIITSDTPKANKIKTPNRRSVSKNEKSPGTLKRRSSLKLRKSESKSILPDEDIKENVDKKRVSRKSVAFDVESCLACSESKSVPSTPRSKRRSKTPMRRS